MTKTAICVGFLVFASFVQAADKPNGGPIALEQKLHGQWVGGPCMGEIIFRGDGTFERQNYSPGGNSLQGVWEIQWNALPPTLVMKCDESDAPHFVGWVLTSNLVRLNDDEFAFQKIGNDRLTSYERKRTTPVSKKP